MSVASYYTCSCCLSQEAAAVAIVQSQLDASQPEMQQGSLSRQQGGVAVKAASHCVLDLRHIAYMMLLLLQEATALDAVQSQLDAFQSEQGSLSRQAGKQHSSQQL